MKEIRKIFFNLTYALFKTWALWYITDCFIWFLRKLGEGYYYNEIIELNTKRAQSITKIGEDTSSLLKATVYLQELAVNKDNIRLFTESVGRDKNASTSKI